MYNKAKRSLEKSGAVVSIIIGVLLLLFVPLYFLGFGELVFLRADGRGGIMGIMGISVIDIVICVILQVTISVIMIVVSALLCKSPVLENGVYKSKIGKAATMISLLAIIFLKYFVSLCNSALTGIGSTLFIPTTIALVLIVYSLCLKSVEEKKKDKIEQTIKTEQPKTENVVKPSTLATEELLRELAERKILEEAKAQAKLAEEKAKAEAEIKAAEEKAKAEAVAKEAEERLKLEQVDNTSTEDLFRQFKELLEKQSENKQQ